MKVWITKYALTQGIEEAEAEVCSDISKTMIRVKSKYGFVDSFFHGNDWHKDKESAISRAETMRLKKIHSLTMKIKKLQKMDFSK